MDYCPDHFFCATRF